MPIITMTCDEKLKLTLQTLPDLYYLHHRGHWLTNSRRQQEAATAQTSLRLRSVPIQTPTIPRTEGSR